MELLQHGVDHTVIALWLGHESVETTQIYIHADLRMKEKALSRVAAPETRPGRYRPDDKLLGTARAGAPAPESRAPGGLPPRRARRLE